MSSKAVIFGLRCLGAVLVILGASGFGISMAVQYTKRLSQLEQLRRMIFLLKGQIVYANASLPEAFEAVGKREKGPLGALFLAAAKQAETLEEANFSAVWEQEIEKLEEKNGREQSALSRSDRQSLAGLGVIWDFLTARCRREIFFCIWRNLMSRSHSSEGIARRPVACIQVLG